MPAGKQKLQHEVCDRVHFTKSLLKFAISLFLKMLSSRQMKNVCAWWLGKGGDGGYHLTLTLFISKAHIQLSFSFALYNMIHLLTLHFTRHKSILK